MTNWEHYYERGCKPYIRIDLSNRMISVDDPEDGHTILVVLYSDSVFDTFKRWKIVDMFYENFYFSWLECVYDQGQSFRYHAFIKNCALTYVHTENEN